MPDLYIFMCTLFAGIHVHVDQVSMRYNFWYLHLIMLKTRVVRDNAVGNGLGHAI